MNNLGWFFQTIEKNYDQTKRYYKDDSDAMFNLGWYYKDIEQNYDQMKRYYLMAIDIGDLDAMNNLGLYYFQIEKDYDQMKRYYFMAANKGHSISIFNLTVFYDDNNLFMDKIIDFYQYNIEIIEDHIAQMFEKCEMTNHKLMDLRSYKNCPEHIKSMQDNYVQSVRNELNSCNVCPEELI